MSETEDDPFIYFYKRLQRQNYFGKFTVSMEAGSVTLVKKEETILPKDLKPKDRN